MIYTNKEEFDRDRNNYAATAADNAANNQGQDERRNASEAWVRDGIEVSQDEIDSSVGESWDRAYDDAAATFDAENVYQGEERYVVLVSYEELMFLMGLHHKPWSAIFRIGPSDVEIVVDSLSTFRDLSALAIDARMPELADKLLEACR